jgi:SAM-dependent methyltransferase
METAYELHTHQVEDDHWWYRGRRRVLSRVIDSLGLAPGVDILDAGCGSGRNMVELAPRGSVTGVELSNTSAAVARSRNVGEVVEGSVEELPFPEDSFDFAVCLDVIEHLDDDLRTLRELRRVIGPGGRLLVTVPAYPSLWSSHDVVNHHRRRYTRASLLKAATDSGWHVSRTTNFNALLLPAAMAYRWWERLSHRQLGERSSDLERTPRWLNRVLRMPLFAEAVLIDRGATIPFGLSLLVVLD